MRFIHCDSDHLSRRSRASLLRKRHRCAMPQSLHSLALCPLRPLAGEGPGMRESLRCCPVVARRVGCAEAAGRSASIQAHPIPFELVTKIQGQLAPQAPSLRADTELSLAYASESLSLAWPRESNQREGHPNLASFRIVLRKPSLVDGARPGIPAGRSTPFDMRFNACRKHGVSPLRVRARWPRSTIARPCASVA